MMKKTIDQLGIVINQLNRAGLQAKGQIDSLISFADYLDFNDYHNLSNDVDDIIQLCADVGETDLIKLADYLDKNKFCALADKVDMIGGLLKTAGNNGFFPIEKKIIENAADDGMIQPGYIGALSTRYCPDHRGVQAARIEEYLYQCPIDGKKYNYQTGYINYDGQKVLGGSVAAQTPMTSNWGGIPMRIYDGRSDVLNRIN